MLTYFIQLNLYYNLRALFVIYIYANIPNKQHDEYYFITGKSLCKIQIQIRFVVQQI